MTSRQPHDQQAITGPLDAYLRLSPDAVLAVDARGRIRAANMLAGELFGYDQAELTGLTVEQLIPERFHAAHAAHRAAYGQAPRHRRMGAGLDLWGRRKDGSEVEVEATLSAVRDRAGRLAGIAVVLRDLTERRLAENEAARARQREQQLLILGDRERIARDLHDRVIQRIFAAGLTLEGTVAMARPVVADRIQAVVGELDAAIAEIQQTIFALEHERPAAGLRAEILNLVTGAAAQLGHQPAISIEGPIETVVSDEAAGHLLAVLREALTNVARHAHARATSIDLAAGDSELVLRVNDDGVGMGDTTRRSGLANLRKRAQALGGSFTISQPPGGGTRLEWRVPLRG